MTYPNLKPEELWVAVQIAWHRNESTLQCTPSQYLLCRKTGIEKQYTLTRIISRLRKKKVLTSISVPNMKNVMRSPNQYYFLFDINAAEKIANSQDFKGDFKSFELILIKLGRA